MALNPADIATVSRLLDEALALPPAERAAWLLSLPPAQQRHAHTLRKMLEQSDSMAFDPMLVALPRLIPHVMPDESVAHAKDRIGPYRLLREIGQGGMGSVWLAERADGSYKRVVAIKLPRLAWGAGLAERMALERDIGALLEHPNIARLYDAGVDETGRPYLALEYVDGQPIDAWCEAQGLNVHQRLRLFMQVIQAVSYAHGRLVVHRDLKPSNVLVSSDGQVHLLDFGIAKLLHESGHESGSASDADESSQTQRQGRVMTPHYASPEQVAGETITVASDVYSLGVLLYELLTGTRPIAPLRSTPGAVEEAVLAGDAPLASIRVHHGTSNRITARALRGEVDAILAKAMQREPVKRYATADALGQDITRHLNGQTVAARPEHWATTLRKTMRRHRLAFSAGAAVTVAVLSGAGISLVQAQRANEAAERARVVKEFVVDVFKVNSRSSSANKQLRQLPAELLLENGAKLIATKFAGQPSLRAELFGVVGGIFADIGAYPLAADYVTRQVDLLAALAAPLPERALASYTLAEILFNDIKLPPAQEQARNALALLATLRPPLAKTDAALRLRATVLLVRVLRRQGLDEQALPQLEAAETLLADEPRPSAARAHVQAIRAAYLSNGNQFDKALPLYNAAIAEALAAEGPLSPSAIDVRLVVARELAAQMRGAEATAYSQAALRALRETGGAADVRAALEESEQAGRMFGMSQIGAAQAEAAITRAQKLTAERGSLVPERIRASINFDLSKVLALSGDVKAADPLISANVATLRALSPGPRERNQYASFQALVAMYAGRHDEADGYFQEVIRVRQELGTSKHPFAIQDYTNWALNRVMQGHYEQAGVALDDVPVLGEQDKASTLTVPYALLVPRMRARLALTQGDAAAALALLPPQQLDDLEPQLPYDDALLRGEVACALGQRDTGLALMEKTLIWHQDKVHPNHPELARARAATGLCALAAGQRPRAMQLAALAQAALAAQPDVSPYFKQPAQRLASLLAAPARRSP